MKKVIRSIVLLSFVLFATPYTRAQSLDRAYDLIEQGKYKEAAVILRPLADGGNTVAQYVAATLFLEGKGVARNPQQAFKYAKMAADNTENHDDTGILLTSWMYYEGIGTKKDTDLALTYAGKVSVYHQEAAAKKLLGEKSNYFDDIPFPTKNEQLAFRYLELLSHTQDKILYQNKLEALSRLSRLSYEGIGTKKDTAQALQYAKMIYNNSQNYFSSDKAYYELVCYYKEQSDTMYFRSLRANNELEKDIATQRSEGIKMKEELIQCYLNGTGCQKNEAMAVQLIDNEKGRLKFLEDPKTLEAYNRVKSQGDTASLGKSIDNNYDAKYLQIILKSIENDSPNGQQRHFQNWLSMAEGGSLSAMWLVSVLYEQGLGTDKDVPEARRWAAKACNEAKAQNWQGDRYPLWELQNYHLKSIPLIVGEEYLGRIVVSCSESSWIISYGVNKGKRHWTQNVDVLEKEPQTYNSKEVKYFIKHTELLTGGARFPLLTSDKLKIYATAMKRAGKPMEEGKYWSFTSENKKWNVVLLTVTADGDIVETTPVDQLPKQEREQPFYYLKMLHYKAEKTFNGKEYDHIVYD